MKKSIEIKKKKNVDGMEKGVFPTLDQWNLFKINIFLTQKQDKKQNTLNNHATLEKINVTEMKN